MAHKVSFCPQRYQESFSEGYGRVQRPCLTMSAEFRTWSVGTCLLKPHLTRGRADMAQLEEHSLEWHFVMLFVQTNKPEKWDSSWFFDYKPNGLMWVKFFWPLTGEFPTQEMMKDPEKVKQMQAEMEQIMKERPTFWSCFCWLDLALLIVSIHIDFFLLKVDVRQRRILRSERPWRSTKRWPRKPLMPWRMILSCRSTGQSLQLKKWRVGFELLVSRIDQKRLWTI